MGFFFYLVLSLSLIEYAADHRGAALVFGLGALWNIAVRIMLVGRGQKIELVPATPARVPTTAQRRAHWRRTMRELAGWQFPIRILIGLTAASVLRHIWPTHHYGWILVSVALLTQRPLEHVPIKITQRALGTALGVGVTWAILTGISSHLLLGALICLLATAAPIARARNYLVYSAIATPVILLVMDIGKPIETSLLSDRLVATLAAAAIVVAANAAMDWLLRQAARTSKAKN